MWKKIVRARFERRLERALEIGALTPTEGEEVRMVAEAGAWDIILLLELLSMILEAILAFLRSRNAPA